VPAASERHRDVPPQTDGVFRRALAKDPAQRYSSCGELVASLRAAYDAAAGSTTIAAPPAPRRRGAPWAALLAVVALLLVAGGILAAVLANGHGHHAAATTAHTTTRRPAATTAPAQPSGAQLNNEAYARMQAGDYAGALQLLQPAVRKRNGTGTTAEA